MHGSILQQLQKYVEEKFGKHIWRELLQAAGQPQDQVFQRASLYPDEIIIAICNAAVQKTSIPLTNLLEDFGFFLGNYLLETYAVIINPSWKTLDLIEKTEEYIHKTLVRTDPSHFSPPKLIPKRISPDEVVIYYNSARKMCPLAVGIGKAIAHFYKETIEITQPHCMFKGDAQCELHFKRVKG